MEDYESTCSKCGYHWRWTGYKTGIGKTATQLTEMEAAGKTCPRCGGEAKVGLDMTSEPAQVFNAFVAGLFQPLFPSKVPSEPPPAQVVKAPNNFGNPVLEVLHGGLARLDEGSVYKSQCLVCDKGVMLVRRDPVTFELQAEDNCIYCGQQYKYLDIEELRQGPGA